MKTVCNGNIQDERQELLDIYKLKGYRRSGNVFKAKYNNIWKNECTLIEFVWNYCKTPSYAGSLINYMESDILDDHIVKKWLNDINVSIDPDLTFANFDEGIKHLSNANSVDDHVHILGEGVDFESATPSVFPINATDGDLFHGIVVTSSSIPLINNVQFIFQSPNEQYNYIFLNDEIKNNVYLLQENKSYEESDGETLYYIPLFKRPIPLVHLVEHQIKLSIRIVVNPNEENIDCRPLLTILCPQLQTWVAGANLLLPLRDDDYLRVGPRSMRIVENQCN